MDTTTRSSRSPIPRRFSAKLLKRGSLKVYEIPAWHGHRGVRRRAPPEDQFGGYELAPGVGELGLGHGRERGDGAVIEATADNRGGLCRRLDRLPDRAAPSANRARS